MSKTIVLGVTGGIAAYKGAALCSRLTQSGYDVRVIMTENATKFVTPLTFRTLSRNAVTTSLWDEPEWKPEHVALANIADLFLVVPATANFIAKFANGIADDALSTFAATFEGKSIVAPAMNPAMWRNPACVENCRKLSERGVIFCGPESGHVACGDPGAGRLTDPEKIFEAVETALK